MVFQIANGFSGGTAYDCQGTLDTASVWAYESNLQIVADDGLAIHYARSHPALIDFPLTSPAYSSTFSNSR